jgi:hypothetical protein
LNKTKEVIRKNLEVSEERWDKYNGYGCEMKELMSESEVINGVFPSPPY